MVTWQVQCGVLSVDAALELLLRAGGCEQLLEVVGRRGRLKRVQVVAPPPALGGGEQRWRREEADGRHAEQQHVLCAHGREHGRHTHMHMHMHMHCATTTR